jgi:cadmium resistance protein CadD (predicted permease)
LYRPWQVVVGQYLGIGVLVAVSLALSLVSRAIPAAYVGLFGLAPVAIGMAKLWSVLRRREPGPLETTPRGWAGRYRKILTVVAVTVSNGGDNVGTYVPLFAALAASEAAGAVAVFAAMTGVWCGLAHYLVNHRALGAPLRRWGRGLLPWILIVLGGVILVKAGALRLILD